MKKYVIVKSVNETGRLAKFHAESGNRYIGKYNGSFCAITGEYDTLEAANKDLADIAMTDADSDCTRYEVFDTESNDTEIERAIYELYQSDKLK